MTERRFPPPWSVEEQKACFVVRDHNGQKLAYIYFEDEPGPQIEVLPHEHPRLGAIATASMNGQDFASLLERAIERSHKGPEVKQIEAHALTSEKSR